MFADMRGFSVQNVARIYSHEVLHAALLYVGLRRRGLYEPTPGWAGRRRPRRPPRP